MINDISTIITRTHSTIKILEQSEFEFYPTGSRFFGGVSANSDYDFFVEDTNAVRNFLAMSGFALDRTAYDEDQLITAVCRISPEHGYNDEIGNYVLPGKEGFDIQLVKDIETKRMIQTILKKRYGDNGIPGTKDQKTELWNVVLDVLRHLSITNS